MSGPPADLPLTGRRVLEGKRVLVTRAAGQASKLSEALCALGAEPVDVPVLEIRPPRSYDALDAALRGLAAYGWLIFTSANTVRALVERSAALGISFEKAAMPQVAAVGEATAATARNAGFAVALVPENYISESLVQVFAARAAGQRVLLARAEMARDLIPDALRMAGAHVDVVDAYRNVLPEDAPKKLRVALEEKIDAATFTSSSSVTHLKEAAEKAGIAFPLAGVQAISIGPITSATLREQGWEPAAEATRSDIAGLVQAAASLLRG